MLPQNSPINNKRNIEHMGHEPYSWHSMSHQPCEQGNTMTRVNADFTQRCTLKPCDYHWQPSPAKGVDRMMLDRIGGEVARATSLVRYAPNSSFKSHSHDGGEEILVLEGEFSDEHGRYPAGTYLRNPIGTAHSPSIGEQGCLILVKLHQFHIHDSQPVNINTHTACWRDGLVKGLQVLSLHNFEHEQVALVRWAPHTVFEPHTHWGGEEIFVIEGVFHDEHGTYPQGSWLRSPPMSRHTPYTQSEGALIYVKVGHL